VGGILTMAVLTDGCLPSARFLLRELTSRGWVWYTLACVGMRGEGPCGDLGE